MSPDRAPWMVPADHAILDLLTSGFRLTPKAIAVNGDYERHYASRRCRALKHAGLLFKDETGSYVLTAYGQHYLDGTVPADEVDPGPPDTYHGFRRSGDRDAVFANDTPLLERINFHSIDIVDVTWGYTGTGPNHLALTLVGDVFDGATAIDHAHTVMTELVVDLDDEWELAADTIREVVEAHDT